MKWIHYEQAMDLIYTHHTQKNLHTNLIYEGSFVLSIHPKLSLVCSFVSSLTHSLSPMHSVTPYSFAGHMSPSYSHDVAPSWERNFSKLSHGKKIYTNRIGWLVGWLLIVRIKYTMYLSKCKQDFSQRIICCLFFLLNDFIIHLLSNDRIHFHCKIWR